MADFNKPVTTDTYTDHFGSIRDKDTSLVKMLDGTSDTNVPTGAKRKNSGQKYRLEEWNGTSWNMVEPGLGDLTQAEVDQLAGIGSTTISGTQWGYLGGLGSAPLEDNDLAANGGTVPEVDRANTFASGQKIKRNGGVSELSLERTDTDIGPAATFVVSGRDSNNNPHEIHQIIYRILDNTDGSELSEVVWQVDDAERMALSRGLSMAGISDLGSGTINAVQSYNDGNATLDTTDLAANGGNVVTEDRNNVFSKAQRIEGTAPGLELIETDTTDKNFFIVANNGIIKLQERDDAFNFTATHSMFHHGGGIEIGEPTGDDQGAGTINAVKSYNNGNATLDTTDLAANGGTVPEVDRPNTFSADQNILGTNYGRWDSGNADIDGLISGSTAGTLIEGDSEFHFTFALRENGSNDAFQWISGGGNYSTDNTYDTKLMELFADGPLVLGNASGGKMGGVGGLNAESIYDNGNRVYSASNAPASTDLSDGTALLSPGGSSEPGIALNTRRTPNASRATWVSVECIVQTDGTSNDGIIIAFVDESGDTTSDYGLVVARAYKDVGAAYQADGALSFLVPAGGSYEIFNSSDPNSSNFISDHREFTL